MKLKTIALAVLLAANGAAQAAPTLQTCSPMEVTHNGASGLSYSLSCSAGGWSLKYTGSVPAGTDSVLARYRVQVSNPDGASFTHNRSVRLPSPSLLGQAIVREAVALDTGDLALRDCEEFSCTLYRPLGSASKVAKSTITVTPEVKRLSADAAQLGAELAQRQRELDIRNAKVAALQQEVSSLTTKLGSAELALLNSKGALDSVKEQYAADLDGLLRSSKAELARAAAEAGPSKAQVEQLHQKLATSTAALDAARMELAECAAKHAAAESAKAKSDAEVRARMHQVEQLQVALKAADSKLKLALDDADSKIAALKRAPAGSHSDEAAALRKKLDITTLNVETLLAKTASLEARLEEAAKQLGDAQAKQATQAHKVHATTDDQERLRAMVEMALANAQITVAELAAAQSAEVGALQTSLTEANAKLTAAQAQLAAAALTAKTGDEGQAKAYEAKVAGLEQALSLANEKLEATLRDQAAKDQSYADLLAAYDKNLTQLAAQHQSRSSAAAGPGAGTGTAGAERDTARAEVARLKAQLAEIGPQVERLDAERVSALKGAQQVAKEMLEALDMIQDLEKSKAEADKALETTTQKLMEMSTKLEAANLARGLAMQAATTAHADADAQNLKNKELAANLAKAQEQVAALQAERDGLSDELQKARFNLDSAAKGKLTGRDDVAALRKAAATIEQERDQLRAEAAAQAQRANRFEAVNAAQAAEIAELRKQLAAAGAQPTVNKR